MIIHSFQHNYNLQSAIAYIEKVEREMKEKGFGYLLPLERR
jgi:hypothetical protein